MTTEVVKALSPHNGGSYIDATLGGGTHAASLLESSAPDGRVLSFDVDLMALERAHERFRPFGNRWTGVEANFRDIERVAGEYGFAPADGILLDLGVSSDELIDPAKGLSFQVAGPLDMRLGPKANIKGLTAAEIVNTWSADDLEQILRDDGEERFAKRITSYLVERRRTKPFSTTLDLAEAVRNAVPRSYERGRIHPATRTFQALRIVVNDEVASLREVIDAARQILVPGGVIVVVSFHSLEDRIVKQAFKAALDLDPLTKRPVVPTETEVNRNPRARSAKLRAAVKIDEQMILKSNSNKCKQKSNIWVTPTPFP